MQFVEFVMWVVLFYLSGYVLSQCVGIMSSSKHRIYVEHFLGAFVGGFVVLIAVPVLCLLGVLDMVGDTYRSSVVWGGVVGAGLVFLCRLVWCVRFLASEALRLWKGPPYTL